MNRWLVRFRVCSPLATPLSADALFGHICWSIAWREGADGVRGFLEQMAGPTPPIVLSEPVHAGFLPMPAILRAGLVRLGLTGRRRMLWAAYRRLGIVPAAALYHAVSDLSAERLREGLEASGWPVPVVPEREVRLRGTADRRTAAPMERKASDWLMLEIWPPDGEAHLEMLVLSPNDADWVRQVLSEALEAGYGRAASAGFGKVEVVSVGPVEGWPTVAEPNAVVALGPCCPADGQVQDGYWRVRTKWGRVGGAFSLRAKGLEAVQKRPVMFLEAGAVMSRCDGEFVGSLVRGVHPERPEVVQYALAPVLPCKLSLEAA